MRWRRRARRSLRRSFGAQKAWASSTKGDTAALAGKAGERTGQRGRLGPCRTFNASLLAELRAIAFVKKLIGRDLLKDPQKARLRDILVHSIKADEALKAFPASTKYDTSWSFLTTLRDLGRDTAAAWLEACERDVGTRSTIDLHADFLDEPEAGRARAPGV